MPGTAVTQEEGSRRYLTGLFLLLGVVTLWTASNFVTANLETGDDQWNKPFLITYLNTSSFTLYLLPYTFRYFSDLRTSDKSTQETRYEPIPQDPAGHPATPSRNARSTREIATIALVWAMLWFIANWALNVALGWTSVASVTVLSTTSNFFTLAVGALFSVETITRSKVISGIASFLGVFLITRSDSRLPQSLSPELPTNPSDMSILLRSASSETLSNDPARPFLGDMLVLFSAFCYALYLVYIRLKVGETKENGKEMRLILGLAGLFNVVCLLPAIPLLHLLGWETFQLPTGRDVWVSCLINMGITLSSDYMYMIAMLKTTPMLATIGLSLTIPLALVVSLFVPGISTASITPLSMFGTGLVVLSFGIIAWQEWKEVESEAAPHIEPIEHH